MPQGLSQGHQPQAKHKCLAGKPDMAHLFEILTRRMVQPLPCFGGGGSVSSSTCRTPPRGAKQLRGSAVGCSSEALLLQLWKGWRCTAQSSRRGKAQVGYASAAMHPAASPFLASRGILNSGADLVTAWLTVQPVEPATTSCCICPPECAVQRWPVPAAWESRPRCPGLTSPQT